MIHHVTLRPTQPSDQPEPPPPVRPDDPIQPKPEPIPVPPGREPSLPSPVREPNTPTAPAGDPPSGEPMRMRDVQREPG